VTVHEETPPEHSKRKTRDHGDSGHGQRTPAVTPRRLMHNAANSLLTVTVLYTVYRPTQISVILPCCACASRCSHMMGKAAGTQACGLPTSAATATLLQCSSHGLINALGPTFTTDKPRFDIDVIGDEYYVRYFSPPLQCMLIGSRTASFKRPLLSVEWTCLSLCMPATSMINISETKQFRGCVQ